MDENPYESPRYGTPDDGAAGGLVYYQALSTRLSVAEYRRISRNTLEFCLGVTARWLRIRLPLTFGFADASHFQRINPEQLSPPARDRIDEVIRAAEALGLHYAFSYSLPTVGTAECAAVALSNTDGRVVMTIVYGRTWTNVLLDEKITYAFLTHLADGRRLITSSSKQELDVPPQFVGEVLPGRPMREVFARHLQRVEEALPLPLALHDAGELEHTLRDYERENFSFQVERGVYVPLNPLTVERLQRNETSLQSPEQQRMIASHQGLEFLCWMLLAAGVLLFLSGTVLTPGQALLRGSLAIIGMLGIAAIWVLRLIESRNAN